MTVLSRKALPDKGDHIIGVITKIQKHGIYIDLKEYEKIVGYCPIGEVASTWIRNIRNFVRIGQIVVAKVLRVDENKGQVDLSIKRVSDQQKREKNLEYKHQNSAIAMLRLISEKYKKSPEEVREIIEDKLLEVYGTLYDALEELSIVGLPAIEEFGFPEKLTEIMHEVAAASIQITTVDISAILRLRSFASDGVFQVKQMLKTAEETAKSFIDITSEITSIGAPSYRIHLVGLSFQEVDEAFSAIENALKEESRELDVEYEVKRENTK